MGRYARHAGDTLNDAQPSGAVNSTSRLFWILVVTVFLGEMLVMLLLESLPQLPALYENLLDSILLLILIFPVLYRFLLRPASIQIADLRQAQAVVQESEERYRTMVEWSPEPIVVHRDGKIVYVNPAAITMFGAGSAQDLIDKPMLDLVHPDFRQSWLERLKIVVAHGANLPMLERKLLRLDGTIIEAETKGTSIVYQGAPAVHLAIRDITERKLSEQRLLRQNSTLSAIIANFPGGISLFDADLRLVEYNEQFKRLLDFPDSLMQKPNLNFEDLIRYNAGRGEYGPDYSEEQIAGIVARARKFEPHRMVRARPDGKALEIHGTPLPNGGFVSIYIDITERKRAEEKIQLAASVFTHAREAIAITDAAGNFIEVNDAFSRITGYGREEIVGKNPRLLQSGRQGKEFYAAMWRDLVEKGHWLGEIWNRRKSGEVYAEMLTISAVRDGQGKTRHYVALFSDITSIKEHEQQLEHIAHYDALTTLPNRVLLADRLHQAMAQVQRREKPLVVAYLDLDGFKAINDNHGHDAGDQLLIAIAGRMKHVLREGDTLARLGGDEFVAVMLDLADIRASEPILKRLLGAASEPVFAGDLILHVSVSLGVTFYPQADDVDADQLLRQADQAMYQAKLAGKNRYHVFDADQDRSVRGRHESLERIRLALSEREFVLHYQPKVNMRTGTVVGAEALIRWQHPERGLLPPAVFLPVIEDHPLAVEVGEWVIDAALKQIELWRAAGLHLPVSVNVGARQLQQVDFVDRLRRNLAAHPNVRPSDLEMEVLETSALEDVARVSEVIQACQEIGVSFALDDFGTGYSSLTYLKRLPVTLLKIDQSFVRDMLDDPDDLAILQGVLGLAGAFRREVIAEGVETMEHGTLLLHLGCEQAQGYGIARPMPAGDLPGWAAAWRTYPDWFNLSSATREDLPLLFASVEHRAWVRAIGEHLSGERKIPPPLNHHQCHLGLWLDGEGQARYGAQPAFKAIEPLHRQVHMSVAQMCELHMRGRKADALESLGELHGLRDALLKHLKILEKNIRQ